jgi:hypothetical protein
MTTAVQECLRLERSSDGVLSIFLVYLVSLVSQVPSPYTLLSTSYFLSLASWIPAFAGMTKERKTVYALLSSHYSSVTNHESPSSANTLDSSAIRKQGIPSTYYSGLIQTAMATAHFFPTFQCVFAKQHFLPVVLLQEE